MNVGAVFAILLIFTSFILLMLKSSKDSKYNSKDHVYYSASRLSHDAKITDFEIKRVGAKMDSVYRTTVLFDDGFQYISHKTNSESLIFGVRISVTPELKMEIIGDAIVAHQEAIKKAEECSGNLEFNNLSEYEKKTPLDIACYIIITLAVLTVIVGVLSMVLTVLIL